MIRRSNYGDEQSLEFTISQCKNWARIPIEMIEKVEVLGSSSCKDHFHDQVVLHFKPPTESESIVYADLIKGLVD